MKRSKTYERRSPEEWRQIAKRSFETKKNLTEFCLDEGIAESTLGYWRKRLRNDLCPAPVPALSFVEVRSEKRTPRWELEVVLPNGTMMRFGGEAA